MKKTTRKEVRRITTLGLATLLGLGTLATPANAAEGSDNIPTMPLTTLEGTQSIQGTDKVDIGVQTADVTEVSDANIINERKNIDKNIRGLEYNKYEILSSNGEKVESFVPKEGVNGNGKFIVIERQKKSLATSPVDISVVNSIVDRTYPGALQLANRSLIENKPVLLLADRKPVDITVNLPGLSTSNTVRVENPNYGTVTGAIDRIINKWQAENGSTHSVPAELQYNESMVYSKSQISAALNVNADFLEKSLGIDFKAIENGEKNVMIASFKQIFYTVSANMPNRPSDLFADNVTWEDLQAAGVNNDNPPLMVTNVAYGRTIYVKLETSSRSRDVEAAFKALIKKVTVEGSTKYSEILNNSSFTAVVLGGDSKKHSEIITKDFDQIRNVIKENSEFSIKNPGYPISYTGTMLKDNSIAVVNNLTEYVETNSTEYTSGRITIDHKGWYVAQFNITWDEVSYDKDGNEVLTPKAWDGNWTDRTSHFVTTIPLPANAKNIKILAREATGLAWEWWRTLLDEHNVPLTKNIKVSLSGTTLYAGAEITHEK